MLIGLARARWAKVAHLPETNFDRLYAAEYLGCALIDQNIYGDDTDAKAEAVAVLRELVDVYRRSELPGDGDDQLATARVAMLLAEALPCGDKEVEDIYRANLELYRREGLEEDSFEIREVASNLAQCLTQSTTPRLAESHALLVSLWRTVERVHGPEAPETLAAACGVADSFQQQSRFGEAARLLRDTHAVQQRVLGR
jgi:hypothetical protein